MPERAALRVHEDVELFREAVNFTARQTRFAARLIEKDYFCSLALQYFATRVPSIVFRGGTCLAKIHLEFYRLSEDLDFLVSTPVDASRRERSGRAKELKTAIAAMAREVRGLRIAEHFAGVNESRQYNAAIAYRSLLAEREEVLKLEVGFREPVLHNAIEGQARTLLLNPINGMRIVPDFSVSALSREEAMAEKLRAALSRREVAIRDFYDVDHAVRLSLLRTDDKALLDLVSQKLAIPGNEPVDVSEQRLATLKRQVGSQLRPVLREEEFEAFDLERAFATIAGIAAALPDRR